MFGPRFFPLRFYPGRYYPVGFTQTGTGGPYAIAATGYFVAGHVANDSFVAGATKSETFIAGHVEALDRDWETTRSEH